MKIKNSVYTVTPPDLTLNTAGPTVLLMGITLADTQPYTDIYDSLFPEVEITFYVCEKGFNPDVAPWFRTVAGMASSIFVNLDNITAEEMFIAMQAEKDNRATIYWISQNKGNPVMVSLLNSYQYHVFSSLDEIENFLIIEYGKTS